MRQVLAFTPVTIRKEHGQHGANLLEMKPTG